MAVNIEFPATHLCMACMEARTTERILVMKIKLANYISETLVANGITQNFSVTGGGAMHLNDAFGHQKDRKSVV